MLICVVLCVCVVMMDGVMLVMVVGMLLCLYCKCVKSVFGEVGIVFDEISVDDAAALRAASSAFAGFRLVL